MKDARRPHHYEDTRRTVNNAPENSRSITEKLLDPTVQEGVNTTTENTASLGDISINISTSTSIRVTISTNSLNNLFW